MDRRPYLGRDWRNPRFRNAEIVYEEPAWKELNAQSSQKVIQKFSDAFQSWFDLRHKSKEANPPGHRKHGDTPPRSTVTFKEDGFKHDTDTDRCSQLPVIVDPVRTMTGNSLQRSV